MKKKFIYWLLMPCRSATFLIEKKLAFGLTPTEEVRLRIHKRLCDPCTQFEKQSKRIDQLFGNITEHAPMVNEALKQQILKNI